MFGVGGSSGGHVHMNELRQDGVEGGGASHSHKVLEVGTWFLPLQEWQAI